jgi:hypothetical protein
MALGILYMCIKRMLFLSEALSIANKMEELCYMLGFDSCFSVNREGGMNHLNGCGKREALYHARGSFRA